jgi:hypothetical protein
MNLKEQAEEFKDLAIGSGYQTSFRRRLLAVEGI